MLPLLNTVTDDGRWFAQHPARGFRLRRLDIGEADECEFPTAGLTHALVHQADGGKIEKWLLSDLRAGADLDAAPDEDAFIEKVLDNLQSPGAFVRSRQIANAFCASQGMVQ